MIKINYKAFSVSKLGNKAEENEDAFWPPNETKINNRKSPFICAISDGATTTSFSRLWANLLVRYSTRSIRKYFKNNLVRYSTRSVRKYFKNNIELAQKNWRNEVDKYKLHWAAEEKAKQGSFATLTKLCISNFTAEGIRIWKAICIGDSCIFQIRQGVLIRSIPIEKSNEFNNDPILISSLQKKNEKIWGNLNNFVFKGEWKIGDQFLLMTDALSRWFLNQFKSDIYANSVIRNITDQDKLTEELFSKTINELREFDDLKNDDTTMVLINILSE